MSKEKFEHYVKFGDFLEWEFVHGNRYGTLTDPLYDVLDDGDVMLLDIDVIGGRNVMEEFPEDTLSIFIEPPGENPGEQLLVLEERLTKRGNENSTLIKQRLRRFDNEISYKKKFDHHFINDDLDTVILNIEKTIKENLK